MKNSRYFGEYPNYSICTLNGKYGLAGNPWGGEEQQILTQAKYDLIYPFRNGRSIVKAGEYYGTIDKYGKEIIPIIHKFIIPYFEKGYYYVSDNHGGNEHNLDCDNREVNVDSGYRSIGERIARLSNSSQDYFWTFETNNSDIYIAEDQDDAVIYNKRLDRIIFRCNSAKLVNHDKIIDSSGLNVPPITGTNVPPVAE